MIYWLGGYMWLFVHRPFEVWPALGAMQFERIYMILMLLYWAVAARKTWPANRLHLALALFAMALAAAWIASPLMDLGTDTVESYAKVMVFGLLVVTSVRGEKNLRRLVLLYLIAANLYMLHSIVEFVHGRFQYRMGIVRMVGVDATYGDPNSFASSLLLTLPLALALWTSHPSGRLRGFLLLHAVMVTACVLLTGSRAGFVGLVACSLLFLVVLQRNRGLLLALGAATLCAGLALPGPLQKRFLTLIDPSYGPQNAQVSADSRMEGLLKGVQAWQASPVLGHGPNSFGKVTNRGLGAHNVYGQVLTETGLFGVAAFAAVLFCFWLNHREARRLRRRLTLPADDLPYAVCRAVSLNILLLLLAGWSGHNLFRYNWQWFAAFQIVALHSLRQRARPAGLQLYSPSRPPPPAISWRSVAAGPWRPLPA